MYKGFEINIGYNTSPFIPEDVRWDSINLYLRGSSTFEANKESIETTLSSYIRPDGRIDGSSMMEDWFPTVSSHVFLSHSHTDETLAIAFSQWLLENFGIKTFIDSTVWGYADKLLKEIDKTYAWRAETHDYDYDLRNRTTAFVHNLLSASLSNMLDKCECLMFLNSPNSIIPNPDKKETSSPWIFYELQQSAVIEKHKNRTEYFSASIMLAEAREFKIGMPAQTSHLTKLRGADLYKWKNIASKYKILNQPLSSLDLLYNLTKRSDRLVSR